MIAPSPFRNCVPAIMAWLAAVTLLAVGAKLHAMNPTPLMPLPADVEPFEGRLAVTPDFSVAVVGRQNGRVDRALARWFERWASRTGIQFVHTTAGAFPAPSATLVVDCETLTGTTPLLGEDESYELTVSRSQVRLRARTDLGVLRGLATLTQLLESDRAGWWLPTVTIRDHPRFAWRGLLIDVCRHWEPIDVIERNLDGMELVKLNVLHLHLTDDQGFRIESQRHPELTALGSDGHFFTPEQIRAIVAYAADRGIRVVPEFDLPGHATSWVVSHPELASAPGPYAVERRWGVFDPVLDPTNERTYALLDGFLGEMAALFPDAYIHIGGDENNGVQWNANPQIQAFIREHGLKDNAGLHAYFNRRVRKILQKHGKKMIGWDEILHPDLPKDNVIQSWRGPDGIAAAAHAGYATILSNGYYIDLCEPAAQLYANDPVPGGTNLTPAEQTRVLGGEATMWGEWVTPETIDSRIWPRTAAIAERLWSPRSVANIDEMYRRLAIVNRRLEEAGLRQDANRPEMIRRFAGDTASARLVAALEVLVDAVEPVKGYQRAKQQPGATQFTPLTGLADCARPESIVARRFAADVAALPAGGAAVTAAIRTQLETWRDAANLIIRDQTSGSPRIATEAVPIAEALADACATGLDATTRSPTDATTDRAWQQTARQRLDAAAKPIGAVELPMIPALRALVGGATADAPAK
ncbi:MAG TPA: family 20 glycosylhydrolase [Opitutaceae bacterium]|nr:family 20 glycosylhydrolase [Opitutaceae bacterium]